MIVVNTGFPRCTPRRPALRINRRVCSRPRRQPRRFMACVHLEHAVDRVSSPGAPCAARRSTVRHGSHGRRAGGSGGPIASRGEEAGDCCPQDTADELDPELIAVGIDKGDHFVAGRSSSAAENADADFKISLALRNSAFSRLSLRISACSERTSFRAARRHRPGPYAATGAPTPRNTKFAGHRLDGLRTQKF